MASEAQEAKEKGNAAFAKGDHMEAVKHFSDAISYDPTNHILFSNRSAAYAAMKRYEEALYDANKCIELNPNFVKGYGRKALALHYLDRFDEAITTYKKGLSFDPNNEQFKAGLAESEQAASCAPQMQNPLANLFSGDIWSKLNNDPRTATYSKNPEIVELFAKLRQEPKLLEQHLGDERVINAVAVLLNLPISEKKPKPAPQPQPSQPKPQPQPQSQTATQPATPISEEKKKALAEKDLGTEDYKKKNWESALQHYRAALELDPDDIVYRSNIAAVYLEMGDFANCVSECEKALEEVSRLKQYKWNGKLLARMGTAYSKMEKWAEAIQCYNKSLTEERLPETLKRLQFAEKMKREADERAYLSPEISLQEKTKGNEFFQKQMFPEAVQCYTEAIKRNPKDHVLYSNRAACYLKLLEFPTALKDAEKCIELYPSFVKGYTRKAAAHFYMKEYHKALAAYDQGLKIDPNNAECQEGMQNVERAVMAQQGSKGPDEEQLKHAMADPEIRAILSDPIMRQVLSDMQQDPRASQRHMANPEISEKISKLMAAGILRMG